MMCCAYHLELPEAKALSRVCKGRSILYEHLRVFTQLGGWQQNLRIVRNLHMPTNKAVLQVITLCRYCAQHSVLLHALKPQETLACRQHHQQRQQRQSACSCMLQPSSHVGLGSSNSCSASGPRVMEHMCIMQKQLMLVLVMGEKSMANLSG